MRILCLGDSITDCGRLWDAPPLGNGYVKIMSMLVILLIEPFLFPYPDQYRLWLPLTEIMSQGIRKLAGKYRLPYLLLQDDFIAAGEMHGWDFITTDGIHLTAQGHQILAGKLLEIIIPAAPADSR